MRREPPVHRAAVDDGRGLHLAGQEGHNGAMGFHLRQAKAEDLRPRLTEHVTGWIGAHRRPFHDHTVGSLVPVAFERYARVLHPAWAPPVAGMAAPVRWDSVATWSSRTAHALAQWECLSVPAAMVVQPPPFAAPPDTGGLPPASLAALCTVLASHTGTPEDCFIAVWDGYGWPVAGWAGPDVLDLENRSFHVRRGPLALALKIGWQVQPGPLRVEPPTLIWPADRAWFVAADTDLDSTYLGGSAALVRAVITHPDLESWPVGTSDDISAASDSINH